MESGYSVSFVLGALRISGLVKIIALKVGHFFRVVYLQLNIICSKWLGCSSES